MNKTDQAVNEKSEDKVKEAIDDLYFFFRSKIITAQIERHTEIDFDRFQIVKACGAVQVTHGKNLIILDAHASSDYENYLAVGSLYFNYKYLDPGERKPERIGYNLFLKNNYEWYSGFVTGFDCAPHPINLFELETKKNVLSITELSNYQFDDLINRLLS